MKSVCKWFLKALVAGLLSFCIISGFCYFYYNLPVHSTVESGATDHKWNGNHFSARGTEGFAVTKTDGNGYVNTFPHTKATTDILVLGSSHTEGFNVNSDENFTYLLNKKLYDNGFDMYAYNIGMSSHTVARCFDNLENAINEYEPTKYVVIDTYSVNPPLEELKQLDAGTFAELTVHSSGLLYQLQKLDFLRLVYSQLSNALSQNEAVASVSEQEVDLTEYRLYLEKMLKKASDICQKNGVELIIVYSPELMIDYNGGVLPQKNLDEIKMFESGCEQNGIKFINMHPEYEKMYLETNHLPRGFANTAVGKGHTNKYGHACFADTLYKYIAEGDNK